MNVPSSATELLVELVNTSAGVHKLLFAGEERMALGADINVNIILGGLGLIYSSASANDNGILIFGMDIRLHD